MTVSTPTIAVVMPVWIQHEWQYIMSVAAINTLRSTTDILFHLVVAEKGSRLDHLPQQFPNLYHHVVTNTGSVNEDTNVGFEFAEKKLKADYIVYTGNDVFTRPGWLEALWKCVGLPYFGAATLAYSAGDFAVPMADLITESIYGPFMMFRSPWRFDAENFPHVFGDTDLIMRIYEGGDRMYMNRRNQVHHMSHATLGHGDFDAARQRFIERHKDSPLAIFPGLAGVPRQ